MLRELTTLIAVVREGSFAAAGAKIGLTQSAVSAQIQRLERKLGMVLFDRQGRTARLNKQGQRVLLQAQELVRAYQNLGELTEGSASTSFVSIGAIASLQRSWLPDVIAKFHKEHPQCRTRILPGLSLELLNLVDAGEIDMAAVIRPPFDQQSDLCWTMLAREPFRLLVPQDVPGEDWAELLSSQPFIRYDRASFGGRMVDRFLRRMHFTLREVCEVDELETIVKLVGNGVGVALIPQTASHECWPATVRALDLRAHTFHRDIVLVHRNAESLNPSVRRLAMLVAQQSQIFQDFPPLD